ncbi:Ribosomal RNA-processing protein 8 [Quillaja saponaria]|uniref:Ribosomal RNA-processing protein 8 n=1 Tax=Quillaja saponaria TaxID=32244 RepID=A0AAD7M694_QUISA|nr:Ribosomal RNA-processing protein 8 [Quillaja saponaria]KAJ7970762.1 Ribosomal RNA-processing protein 8 [Quillaja saponaria]
MKKKEHRRKRKRPNHLGPKKNEMLAHEEDTKTNNYEVKEIGGICVNVHNDESARRRKSKEPSKASSFLDKMRARLSGGHFRMLNEKLYTCTGEEALNYFQGDPSLFEVYHAGYKTQMANWPDQPVNVIINWLKRQSPSLVVADFGCGDAHLAKSVKNEVFSLDLVSKDPNIIACDMSNTPLGSSSVDVAVFCLSLMGTNFQSYLEEAHRVLKPCGWLLIAEVKSRFDPNTGGADPVKFSNAICELGFDSMSQDFSNKMFILLYFKKKNKPSTQKKEIEWPVLKPCLYKRR